MSDKLRQVPDYPEEVDEPILSATDDDMENTIAWMILYGSQKQDVAKLKTFIEDQVKPQLERAEGIAEVPVYGGLDREIQVVVVDAHMLASRGLTFRDVERALRGQKREHLGRPRSNQGKRDYTYRTVGEYRTIQDVEDTVIAYDEGGPILLRDVGTVVDGFKRQMAFVRSEGKFVIAMPAKRGDRCERDPRDAKPPGAHRRGEPGDSRSARPGSSS